MRHLEHSFVSILYLRFRGVASEGYLTSHAHDHQLIQPVAAMPDAEEKSHQVFVHGFYYSLGHTVFEHSTCIGLPSSSLMVTVAHSQPTHLSIAFPTIKERASLSTGPPCVYFYGTIISRFLLQITAHFQPSS